MYILIKEYLARVYPLCVGVCTCVPHVLNVVSTRCVERELYFCTTSCTTRVPVHGGSGVSTKHFKLCVCFVCARDTHTHTHFTNPRT